jgi:hypothetical protein
MGDRLEQLKTLGQVLVWQEKLATNPLTAWMVGPHHVYESMSDFAKAAGIGCLSPYVMDPQSPQGQQAFQAHMQAMQNRPQGQDDASVKALIQMEQIKAQSRAQIEQLREANKAAIEQLKSQHAQASEARSYQEHLDKMKFQYDELEQRLVEKMTALEVEFAKQIPYGMA